jgi:hypothetical protein
VSVLVERLTARSRSPNDGRCALLATIATVVALAGCCSGPSEKALRDVLPYSMSDHAYRRFAIAVCDDDWGLAYDRLAKSNRDQISYIEFRVGVPFAKDPRTGISIIDLIRRSAKTVYFDDRQSARKDVEFLMLLCTTTDSDGKLVGYRVRIPMLDEREDGAEEADWKVDLLYAAERIASGAG